jgi:hypothetical protein
MTYRPRTERNWGVLIACALAVPLTPGWFVAIFVGGSLVCADPAARCGTGSGLGSLLIGFGAVATGAALLGWMINRLLRLLRLRR